MRLQFFKVMAQFPDIVAWIEPCGIRGLPSYTPSPAGEGEG